MALPASDSFSSGSGALLTTYSANWAFVQGQFRVESNEVRASTGGTECCARWSGDSFTSDQYARVTAVAPFGYSVGPAVRAQSGVASWYGAYSYAGDEYFYKVIGGVYTEFLVSADDPASGVVVELQAEGSTLRVYYNGALKFTQTDSSLSGGAAGLAGYGDNATARGDDWEGGNLGAGSLTVGAGLAAGSGRGLAVQPVVGAIGVAAGLATAQAEALAVTAAVAPPGVIQRTLALAEGRARALVVVVSGGAAAPETPSSPTVAVRGWLGPTVEAAAALGATCTVRGMIVEGCELRVEG